MYSKIITLTAFNAYVMQLNQVSISTYLMYVTLILSGMTVLNFIVGLLIEKFMIENDFIWLLFNGYEYSDTGEDIAFYLKNNTPKFIIEMSALVIFYLASSRII